VENAAGAVSEILLTQNTPSLFAHVENPVRQAWSDIIQVLAKELKIQKSLPFDQWLDKLASVDDKDSEAYPAKKLHQFFKLYFRTASCGRVIMGTDSARQISRSLRSLTAVDDATVSGYVRYWKQVGYLN
jgi:hypothetical protein